MQRSPRTKPIAVRKRLALRSSPFLAQRAELVRESRKGNSRLQSNRSSQTEQPRAHSTARAEEWAQSKRPNAPNKTVLPVLLPTPPHEFRFRELPDQFLYTFLAFLGRYRGFVQRPKNPPTGPSSFATTPVARPTSAKNSASKLKTSGRPDVRMSSECPSLSLRPFRLLAHAPRTSRPWVQKIEFPLASVIYTYVY
jgi:hypothetical protein